MTTGPCRVLLLSGSVRDGSTNTAVLRTARAVAPDGVAAALYGGLDGLPHFNPDLDHDPLPPTVSELRSEVHAADALLISTPEYAGALPGAFKNLLEWTVGDDQTGSISEKPVAWINASASPAGATDAHESLATVLGYVHASVVEPACARIPVTRADLGYDGLVVDPAIRSELTGVLDVLARATDR